jgi:hypothetical protein
MTDYLKHLDRAIHLWRDEFDHNERTGVRFGLFPAGKMKAAEDEGYDGLQLCIALTHVAKANGRMRA